MHDGQATEAMTAVIVALLAQREALALRLGEHVQAGVAGYQQNPAFGAESQAEVNEQVLTTVFSRFTTGQTFDTSFVRRVGRERARTGVPLSMVLEAYRVGTAFIWQTLADAAQAAGVPADDLVAVTASLWQAQELLTSAMAEGYREEQTSLLIRQHDERAALVESLVTGRVLSEATLWEIADVLQLPTNGPFIVVAAALSDLGRQVLPNVEERLRVADVSSAWRLLPDQQVGIIRHRSTAELRRVLVELRRYPAARQGVSPTFDSLAAAASALRFARIALTASPPEGGVVAFDDAPLAVTAVAAPDVSRRIAETVLGPLDTMRTKDRKIMRDTFEVWMRSGGSAEVASRELFCHPNTVRLRLRSIEQRTGRSLSDPRQLTELCLAFEIERHLDPAS